MENLKETILLLIKDVPFFDCFTHDEIAILLEKCSWLKELPGNRIITTGEVDFRMFILIMGRAQVILNEKVLAVLSAGDVFGEVGLLGGLRTADVEAQTECLMLTFEADHLNDLPIELQLKFLKRIFAVMVARLQKLNQHEWLRYQTRKIDTLPNGRATKKPSDENGRV
jgi:CRP-like cAMP-binding protein